MLLLHVDVVTHVVHVLNLIGSALQDEVEERVLHYLSILRGVG